MRVNGLSVDVYTELWAFPADTYQGRPISGHPQDPLRRIRQEVCEVF